MIKISTTHTGELVYLRWFNNGRSFRKFPTKSGSNGQSPSTATSHNELIVLGVFSNRCTECPSTESVKALGTSLCQHLSVEKTLQQKWCYVQFLLYESWIISRSVPSESQVGSELLAYVWNIKSRDVVPLEHHRLPYLQIRQGETRYMGSLTTALW